MLFSLEVVMAGAGCRSGEEPQARQPPSRLNLGKRRKKHLPRRESCSERGAQAGAGALADVPKDVLKVLAPACPWTYPCFFLPASVEHITRLLLIFSHYFHRLSHPTKDSQHCSDSWHGLSTLQPPFLPIIVPRHGIDIPTACPRPPPPPMPAVQL